MSIDLAGGLNYPLLKRHYDADDHVAIASTANQDYYTVGTMAYLSDPTVFNPYIGWTIYAHGQAAMPTWLATLIAFGIIPTFTWPAQVPAFEAKDLLFHCDQNCLVRFEGPSRIQHYIPQNTYMRFHRRCFMFFVQRDTIDGVLRCWLEG